MRAEIGTFVHRNMVVHQRLQGKVNKIENFHVSEWEFIGVAQNITGRICLFFFSVNTKCITRLILEALLLPFAQQGRLEQMETRKQLFIIIQLFKL